MNTLGHLLVVEDDELERKALVTKLKNEGFTVYGAENADKAFSYVDEEINVVLSDLHMGDVSGIDLLNLWKQRKPDTHFIVLMNQYHARCVARLATRLDAVPEADGTFLDNTLIVWANEQGRGDHSLSNVPTVLIGRAGGALPEGGRLIDRGPQIFNRLGCSILNLMGKPAAGFGDAADCGSFEGLV